MNNDLYIGPFIPKPGNRCGFSPKGRSRYVNGLITKIEITSKTIWVHVRLTNKWPGCRKSVYRVRLHHLQGWTLTKGCIREKAQ